MYLLPHEPATAYAIGKAIGRPTANVYKAVDQLARLGAVLIEEGESRVCRAIAPEEFIRQTELAFRERAAAAAAALGRLEKEDFDERVYRVESVGAVLERARAMLAGAETVAVVDAFPLALAPVVEAVAGAAKRGVRVFIEAYEPVVVAAAKVVVVPNGERSVAAWRSQQLNVVVDGREHLLALLRDDLGEVHQAVWSASAYLSCILHAGRMSEIMLIERMNELESTGSDPSRALSGSEFFRNSDVPGHRELLARFAPRPTRGDGQ